MKKTLHKCRSLVTVIDSLLDAYVFTLCVQVIFLVLNHIFFFLCKSANQQNMIHSVEKKNVPSCIHALVRVRSQSERKVNNINKSSYTFLALGRSGHASFLIFKIRKEKELIQLL